MVTQISQRILHIYIYISQYIIYSLNCELFFKYILCLKLCFKIHARFVSSFFCIYLKTPFFVFTSQKSSQMLRESRCSHLSNKGLIGKISSDIHQNIQHNCFTLPISKYFNKISQFQNLQ